MKDYFNQYGGILSSMGKGFLEQSSAQSHTASRARGLDLSIAVDAGRLLLGQSVESGAIAAGFEKLNGVLPDAKGKYGLADPAGHSRDVYYPFALHLLLSAYQRSYETMPSALWGRCQSLTEQLAQSIAHCKQFAHQAPPAEQTALVLFQALCLAQLGQLDQRDIDLEIAQGIVHHIIQRVGDGRSLHPLEKNVTLDAWTYRELTGLHALANIALLLRNKSWSVRVREIALYHQENTQPDNTTNQPWGVFAFIWSQQTALFADQQLHDCATQQKTRAGSAAKTDPHATGSIVAGMLLADAYNQIQAFN